MGIPGLLHGDGDEMHGDGDGPCKKASHRELFNPYKPLVHINYIYS